MTWRFGLGVVIAFLIGVVLFGCASVPRPADWPARSCGGADREWTLAELLPQRTKILARASWRDFVLGDVLVLRKSGEAVMQVPVRVRPWAGQTGVSLWWAEENEYELPLQSADASACYYLSLNPGLVLFRVRGSLPEMVYLSVGPRRWVPINPRGGPAF